MTINLAAVPMCADQLDLLSLVADNVTPLGTLHRDDFRAACEAVADEYGYVNPNLVSAYLHDHFGDVNARWYASQWAPACGDSGFMDKLSHEVPIDPKHSRGNGNKAVKWRRLRSTHPASP